MCIAHIHTDKSICLKHFKLLKISRSDSHLKSWSGTRGPSCSRAFPGQLKSGSPLWPFSSILMDLGDLKINLLPSQAFFLLGSILNLPGLKFYLLYCEQGKTRPHERTASELGKQGIFFPSRHTLEKKFLVFLAR